MARLFADEDFSLPVVEELRRLGHDVITVMEIGKANQRWPDDAVFTFALRDQRAILTKNRRHFYKLHAQNPAHSGIVACSETPDFLGVAQKIHAAIRSSENLAGKFIRVYQSS